ncbi:hypothetical protein [Hyphomicrobium sp.]|uniref:hypothetical protein n=1 Tax=Hyphomicrobium sp. TaxID=82 RepID=UPI002FE30698
MDTAVGSDAQTSRLSPVERALVFANGKAPTVLVTALQARGHLDVKEFAGLLGVFSVVVGEEDDLEATILALWAGIMEDSVSC